MINTNPHSLASNNDLLLIRNRMMNVKEINKIFAFYVVHKSPFVKDKLKFLSELISKFTIKSEIIIKLLIY